MEHNAILDSKLSLSSNIPLYAQLVGIIKREISSGALKIGDLLPSEAELCRALDISRNTARETGIPKGLHYLTGFVGLYEMMADTE